MLQKTNQRLLTYVVSTTEYSAEDIISDYGFLLPLANTLMLTLRRITQGVIR